MYKGLPDRPFPLPTPTRKHSLFSTLDSRSETYSLFGHKMLDLTNTTFNRVMSKFSSLGLNKNAWNNDDLDEVKGTPPKVYGKDLGYNLKKLNKQQTDLSKFQTNLEKQFEDFLSNTTNHECQNILKGASNLFTIQNNGMKTISELDQKVRQSLEVVTEKEQTLNKLYVTRTKLKQEYNNAISKFGANSNNAQKKEEELETNMANIQMAEKHLNKAISGTLKQLLNNYALGLRTYGISLDHQVVNYEHATQGKLLNSEELPFPLVAKKKSVRKMKHEPEFQGFNCVNCSIELGKPTGCRNPNVCLKENTEFPAATRLKPSLDDINVPVNIHSEWA